MRVVLLTNILTPYRIYFYDMLYQEYKNNNIDFKVLVMAKSNSGRRWKYDELKREYTIALEYKTVKFKGTYLYFNKNLKKKYMELNPDIVICGGGYALPSIKKTVKLRKKFGFKLIYWNESHLGEKKEYIKPIIIYREYLRKKIFNIFDGFWYAGKLSKEFIEKYLVMQNTKKFIFCPNLINSRDFDSVNKFTQREIEELKIKYKLSKECKNYLISARLTKVKGIEEFLNVFKEVKNNNIKILIAGEGELKENIEEIINTYNLPVRMIGYRNVEEMKELYAIVDGVIMPSLSDPNPLSIIEACWCKKTLLVSEHVGNYPEAIIEGENGYVFSYSDTDKAKEIINNYFNQSDDWYTSAGEKSYKIANEMYDEYKIVHQIAVESLLK